MFNKIFLFELKYRVKRPATWAYFGILFLFGFFVAIYGNTPASEKTFANSPYSIAFMLTIISIFGTLIASAVMGVPVYRDIEHNVKSFFFTLPISEKGYLLGRYVGSLVMLLVISLGLPLGLMLGFALGPYLGLEEAERFGPFNLMYYINPILALYWPNLILTGTTFFALVALTRKVFISYVGSILFFIGYLLANTLVQDLEMRDTVDIIDPFAFNAFENLTRYWTPVEQNEQLISLTGNLLWNRVLWIGLSLAILGFTLLRFDFQRFLAVRIKGKRTRRDGSASRKPSIRPTGKLPSVKQYFSTGTHFRHLMRMTRLEFTNIITDIYFIAILLGGVLFLFLDAWFGFTMYGTPSLPTTYYMLEVKDWDYIIFVFIIIIFYTGETVHRDKSVKYAGIADALPLPNWVYYMSKFTALILICFFLVNMVLVSGLLNQIIKGYYQFNFISTLPIST